MPNETPKLLANDDADAKAKAAFDWFETMIVAEQYHHFEGTAVTVCCLTLINGFTVTGKSSAGNPVEFDADVGRVLARLDAIRSLAMFTAFAKADARAEIKLLQAE